MSIEGSVCLCVLADGGEGWVGGGGGAVSDLGWWADVCVPSAFWDLVSTLSHKGPRGNVCIK